jgi:hypothetical protein
LKRNFSVVVKNYEGHPFVRPVYEFDEAGIPVMGANGQQKFVKHEPMTLRIFALEALAGRWRGEDNMTVEEASKRMKLHDKLAFATGDTEITGEEGLLILDCLRKQGSTPIVIGRMKELLDTDPPQTH